MNPVSIINFGSYCIDNVYAVPYFVKPGETLASVDYQVHPGGKGLNQSLALAHAGISLKHAGRVGHDGIWLKTLLSEAGVDTSLTQVVDIPTGHANIQVVPSGENAIVIYGGANKTLKRQDFIDALADTSPGDFLLIQNETSYLPDLINIAAEKNQRIIFNAAPITDEVSSYPLEKVEFFVLNEIEAEAISGKDKPQEIMDSLLARYPDSKIILTLGESGAIYRDKEQQYRQGAFKVKAVDSTGAGDTFTGYFFAGFMQGLSIEQCLENACKAAAICVGRQGAASSIPRLDELESF
jgi:ribokinase